MMDPETSATNSRELTHHTLKGITWLLGSRLWSQLLSLIIGIVLARLLRPEDYGLLGMAMIVVTFLGLFSDFGLTSAIIHEQNLDAEKLSSIFWFNLGAGLGIAALMAATSPVFASFFSQAKVVPILCALSLNFIAISLGTVPSALFQKALRFDIITKINATSSLIGGCLGIAAATAGCGVWSLVLQVLGTSLLGLFFLWVLSSWRPRMRFVWADLDSILKFSSNFLGAQMINYLARHADYLLIGRFLGPAALGNYTLAYNLMLFPINNLTGVIQQGMFPALARIKDKPRSIAHAYIKSCRYQAFIIIPAMSGLALVAPEAVSTIYGAKWTDAGPVLALLSWVAVFQPFASLAGVVLLAQGFTDWLFKWSLIVTPVIIAGFAIGLSWGIVGVAAGYLIVQILLAVIAQPLMFRKAGIPTGQLLASLAVPAVASAVMAVAVYLARKALLDISGISAPIILTVCVATGVLVYGVALLALKDHFWTEFKRDYIQIFKSTVEI
ncbi:MAG: MOP flippase family protein [Deltaproteobacteria bacterium]|nr:MOP flippase family protein [Deltaproteobacteria bacterium]